MMEKKNNDPISVAVICIENKGVKTERNYFDACKEGRRTKGKGLKYSRCVLEKLGIKHLMFYSIDFSKFEDDSGNERVAKVQAWKNKVESWFKNIKGADPEVSKLFILCDRDANYPMSKIKKRVKLIEEAQKSVNNDRTGTKKSNRDEDSVSLFDDGIYLLEYKNHLDKFEHFLALHQNIKDYQKQVAELSTNKWKTEPIIFQKLMGKNCENFNTLIKNIEVRQPCFLEFFKDHSK